MSAPADITVTCQPRIADLTDGMLVEGIYRVSHVAKPATPHWCSKFVRLRDSSRSLQCLARAAVMSGLPELSWRAVRVRFTTFRHPTYGLEGHIDSINIVDDVPDELVLDLLPHPHKVKPDVQRLRELIEGLSPTMQSFCCTVLRDDRIARALLVNPASRTFHHTQRGGLLAHCIETAERASHDHGASRQEREIAVVAGLFHDIGKTITLNYQGLHTECGAFIDHDSMTLELCASALRALERSSPRLALELRHAWTAAYRGQYGVAPKLDLVRALRNADRWSANRARGNTPPMAATVAAAH